MIRAIIVVVILIITTIIVSPLSATTDAKYMLTERFNRPFCDMDKANKDDGKMCWATSIANMLEFAIKRDAKVVFHFLKKEFGNKSESMYNGLLYIFKLLGLKMESFLLITSFDYKKVNKRMDLCIIGMLYQGRVVNIGVNKTLNTKIGHGLTVYGFERNKSDLYIFYVDSNDGIRKLYRERIKHKRGITRFTTGKYKNHIIDTIVSLQVFD